MECLGVNKRNYHLYLQGATTHDNTQVYQTQGTSLVTVDPLIPLSAVVVHGPFHREGIISGWTGLCTVSAVRGSDK